MPQLISDIHIRLSQEELGDLQELGAVHQASVSSVIRAMVRDYLIRWRKDKALELQLGVVKWPR